MTTILQLIRNAAAKGVHAPKLRLGGYKFSYAASKAAIWVTDMGAYGSNTYFGKIDGSTGDFMPAAGTSTQVKQEIIRIMENPGLAAKVFGRKTGTCCCCGRLLVNKESVRLMIGPICMEKYGFVRSDLIDDEPDNTDEIKLSDI